VINFWRVSAYVACVYDDTLIFSKVTQTVLITMMWCVAGMSDKYSERLLDSHAAAAISVIVRR